MKSWCAGIVAAHRAVTPRISSSAFWAAPGQRVVAAGLPFLADQQVQPALHREELILVHHDAAVAAEQLEPFLQALRQLHAPAMTPELPRTLRLVVMHNQEVADALVFEGDLAVVAIDVGLPETAVGKVIQQQGDATVDQVNAGGFERLEEARGEPDGDAV